ncbi:MAG: Hsp70 family protein [Oscillospiraceae bacterium]|nr:Hsp70 family protein [Oscillospiraceae bacterium]
MQYWGFDLGDGESTLARVSSEGKSYPEIVEVEGNKVIITVWAIMRDGEVRIGDNAARSAAAAVRSAARFKRRFLNAQSDSAALIRDFSARVFEALRGSGELVGGEKSNSVYVGCPAGWNAEARERYQRIFETIGFPTPHVVSESRAVMVGAIQSNSVRDYIDLRSKTVLVIDIGSSTTDFAYINKGKEAEIRTGGEVALGGGVMDEVLLNTCVSRSPNAAALRRVLDESESWRVDCELHARHLKERYYSMTAEERAEQECAESLLITYDDPLILDLKMDADTSKTLTDRPCPQLNGKSFRQVFCAGLREVRDSIGSEQPELLFLTGGVSRMEEIRVWCQEVFSDSVIYTDREPEFSVARGLAWCGRIDDDLAHFRADVDELISSNTVEELVSGRLNDLYRSALDYLLDPLLEQAVKPVLLDWKNGKIPRLCDMESALQEHIKVYLYSEEARQSLHQPVTDWLLSVSEELEQYTSEICRRYHVPERSLEISSALTASDFSLLEKLEAKDVLAGDTLTWTAVFVESIISILIAMLCGGSGVVLISEGPIGMLIGFLLSFLVLMVSHAMGKKAIDEKLMTANLPLAIRRMALSASLPRIEAPNLGISDAVKKVQLGQLFSDEESDSAASSPAQESGRKRHLLPRLSWGSGDSISERRMQAIRNRIRQNYEKLLNSADNEDLLALNSRMSRDISKQIESRLKELAEQVEIPL